MNKINITKEQLDLLESLVVAYMVLIQEEDTPTNSEALCIIDEVWDRSFNVVEYSNKITSDKFREAMMSCSDKTFSEEDLKEISGCLEPTFTTEVETCGNRGCGFNKNNLCTASGTGCYSYIGED